MARAAQMGKRLVARAKSADDEEVVGEPRVIPIDLLPLLAPHKKHGKVTLRVERLPQQTRLSAGTRNNDGSWSLTRDDLEDLEYIVPDGVEGATSLSVRVVSLTAGSTIAVLDYPVGAAEETPAVEGRHDVAGEDSQVERLLDELAKVKASLVERDRVLAAAPAAEASLVAAETRWAAEMDARLTAEAAKAALQLEQTRRAWDAEQSERLAKLEARAQEMIAEARERALNDARETLLATERAWKAEEAVRLATAEAAWREQLAKAGAEADARVAAAAAVGGHSDAELRAVREQVAALQAALGARDAALAVADEAAARAKRDGEDALAKAQSAWAVAEAARVADAEAQWRAKLEAASVASTDQQSDAELRSVRQELAAVRSTLAARDAALAAANETTVRAMRDGEDALAKAQSEWKVAEAARLEAALAGKASERESGLLSEIALLKAAVVERDAALKRAEDAAARAAAAEEHAREVMPAALESDKDAELRRLREKAVALETKLIKANKAFEDDQLKWQREAQEAISRATKEWVAKEGSRRASTEALVRKEIGGQLAQATSRYEAAEAALAQIRLREARVDTGRNEVELAGARTALAAREAELTRLREEVEALRNGVPAPVEAPVVAVASNRYVRDVSIAAAIGVAVVVVYPFVSGLMAAPPPAPVVARVVEAPAPPPPVFERTAVLALDARLRAGPSTKVGVIAPLDRGTSVTVLEERGEWIRVRAAGTPSREGWVKVSQLKDITPSFAPIP